jgi:TolB-like protein
VPAFVALRALRPPAATPSVPDFAPPPHSVAVLAFDNLSGDPSQEYFSDGLAEELITTLGRIDKILVAARVSAFSFKHTTATVADIAHALNVGAVLEGSVRRDGSSLRINVELIDARTGFQIWSRSFDRGLGDRLQVQADIATAVAGALQVSMLGADPKKLTSGGTENPAAFDAYLRGMTLMRTGVVADYKAALAEFDTAVKLDPGFVRGHAGRAYALVDIAVTTVSNDPAIMKKAFADARAAAEHAVALGPDVAQGHGALSTVLDLGFLDPVGADAEAARAVALEPANAAILSNFAEVELDVGHTEQGIAAARRTTALDPLRPDVWRALAFVLFEARRYAEATDALNRVRPLTAKLPSTWYDLLARIELAQGNATAALTDCARGTEGEREKCAAMANHALGNTEAATAALAKLRALVGDTGAFDYAEIFAQWGDVPQALHWLETALALRDPQISQLKADPSLDPIRDDPRFKAVEAALHFPP